MFINVYKLYIFNVYITKLSGMQITISMLDIIKIGGKTQK